jgi:hypothetical protein
MQRPDVLVIDRDWPERALLRAQLVEEGYEAVATDEWPIPATYRRPDMLPRVMVVDLHGIPAPRDVLSEIPSVLQPDRVVIVTALGAVPVDEIRKIGYHVVPRPTTVGQIVAAVARLLRVERGLQPPRRGDRAG